MSQKSISEETIYQLVLEEKKHHETTRDNINNQYISLFSAIIAVTPFINNITDKIESNYEDLIVAFSIAILSLIGLVLSVTWSANLRRILFCLESLDKIIKELEDRHNIAFVTYISAQLKNKRSPGRITKYQLIMPRMFIAIFISLIIYSFLNTRFFIN